MSRLGLTACLIVLVLPGISAGAESEDGRPEGLGTQPPRAQATPDFLFGRPKSAVGLRFRWARARADSDLFAFLTEELTLSKRDFDAPGLALDFAFPINSRVDVLAGIDFGRTSVLSEDREFVELVDGQRLPIQQESALSQVDISGSLEFALTPRGRAVGQFAWIPASVTPYVGAGAGLLWYRFEQEGDFVDAFDPDLSVFTARLSSDGWTVSSHVFTGVDIRLARRLLLTGEIRYLRADATMSRDYLDFEPIDLSGVRISGGIQFLF